MGNSVEDSKKPMVLIVDDEITARFIARESLSEAGFDVEEAEDGAVALKMLEELKPDIVVADVMMPVMDGFTLCEEIRRRPGGELLPILMVTGLDDTASIHRAYEVGATDFITKPFNWLVLCQRIRHMVRESKLVQNLQRSERKNSALLSAIPDMMFRIDNDGTILESKESKDTPFVNLQDKVRGKKLPEVLPPGVVQNIMEAITNALKNGATENLEYQLIINGTVHHFEARLVASEHNETLCIVRDITKRKTSENALKESEERYALAIEGANDGLWDWDMRANEIHYSLRWKSMLGWKDNEVSRSPDEWFRRIHPEDIEQLRILLNAHLEGSSPHFEIEHRIVHRDGTYLWVLTRGIAVRDETGKPYRMAGSQADVTDHRRAQDQLFRNAYYDALTGLANRTLLTDRLAQSLGRTKRSGDKTFAVLFLDLDRFKNINDTLGHSAGDKILICVGEKLQSCVRPGDTVARLGGDEFVILLENVTGLAETTTITERIEQALSLPIDFEGQEIFAVASIGIVVASGDYEKPEDVLRDADIAVYRAKAMGRRCHVVFDPKIYQKMIALIELESDLRKVVERQELLLHYQPIVSLETGSLVSVEALVRWQHPKRGLLSPDEFIPLAEETGLIIPIGEWILRRVCEQVSEWQRSNGTSPIVAVNVSGHQVRQSDFTSTVKAILDQYDLSPDSIELEITETVLMNNFEQTKNVFSELRKMGFRLSLDDFGTGYSSLSYLQQFPVQKLKVDRSFIVRLGLDSDNSEIVKAILQLANKLGLDVVAEGVETDRAASRLREMGCKLVQGFYFGRPSEGNNLQFSINETKALEAV